MKVELRGGKELAFEGYVNAVERDSRIIRQDERRFVEQIKAGVWKRALERNSDVFLLLNHIPGRVLGQNGVNVRLYEDNIGLRIEGCTEDAEVIEAAKNHQLRGFSFAFEALKQSFEPVDGELERRFVEDLMLKEVSMLTLTPAYYGTQIYTRDEDTVVISVRYTEDKQGDLKEEPVIEERKDEGEENIPFADYSAEYDKYQFI